MRPAGILANLPRPGNGAAGGGPGQSLSGRSGRRLASRLIPAAAIARRGRMGAPEQFDPDREVPEAFRAVAQRSHRHGPIRIARVATPDVQGKRIRGLQATRGMMNAGLAGRPSFPVHE